MSTTGTPRRHIPYWYWGLLYLPFGISSGFVDVTLVYILTHGKFTLDLQTVGALTALATLPHTFKFFWSPIADVTLTRKRWYLISNVLCAGAVAVIAFTPITPDATPTLRVLIFLSSLAATVLGMAVEGLMAHAITPEERGRAAGWFQAGNLGGAGIGGGIALLLAQRFSTQAAFLVTAGLMLSCTYVLRLVPEAPSIHPEGSFVTRFGKAMLEVLRDLWRMVANRKGIVGVLLVFLPIGSAAGGALFSAMADHWGASGKLVALTSGVLAGLVAMVGCLVGGWLSDRIGRRTSYITAGVILALIAVAMALTPKTPVTYVTFVLVYQFGSGIAYGTFTGFVLSVIGKGAVATKYTLMAALSNIPIMYMKYINGWAAENHGLINMLYVDALSEVLGIVALLLIIVAVRPGADEN